MRRAYISEWLLALFTPRERAAAIVGDLLELHTTPAAFWRAVIRTMWAMSWRFGLGLLLAAPAELYTFFFIFSFAVSSPHHVDGMAHWSCWFGSLCIASALFSLVRFGASDAITRLSTALALLAGLDLFFWWVPFVRPGIRVMAVMIVLLSCRTRQGRFALRRFMGAILAAAAPLFAILYLVYRSFAERQIGLGCGNPKPCVIVDPMVNFMPLAFLLSSAILAAMLDRHKEGRSQLG